MTDRYTHIIPYCAQPSSPRQLQHLDRFPWRHMMSPSRPYRRMRECAGYAIDNGAWVCHKRGSPFQPAPFLDDVERYGDDADFLVIPDKVEDAIETHRMASTWIKRLEGYRLVFVAQDGMVADDLEQYAQDGIGVFIGGSTPWKLRSIKPMSDMCARHGVICHVGRVNTRRRVDLCIRDGAHSFDGSGPSRYEETARLLTDHMLLLERDLFPRPMDSIKRRYIYHE
jgi:hypothetical protein